MRIFKQIEQLKAIIGNDDSGEEEAVDEVRLKSTARKNSGQFNGPAIQLDDFNVVLDEFTNGTSKH